MKKLKKAWFRALSFILAVTMIATAAPSISIAVDASMMGANGAQSQPSVPGNGNFFIPGRADKLLTKTATPVDGQDGYYDITLEMTQGVSTSSTTKKKTDIVLVIDQSNSMSDTYGIMGKVREAAKDLVDKVLKGNEDVVRIAVVSFGSKAYQRIGLSNSSWQVKNAINNIYANGGTNAEAGLKSAYDILAQSQAEQKFVVFFSDGNPTYRETVIDGSTGSGSSDPYGYNKDCAVAWADVLSAPSSQTLTKEVGGVNVFQNKRGLGAEVFAISYPEGTVDNEDFASDSAHHIEIPRGAEFSPYFNDIAKRIVNTVLNNYTAEDTVLTDTVSEYFDIVSEPEDIQVTRDGKPIEASSAIKGQDVSVQFGDIQTDLDGNHTYRVTFRVKLRDDACIAAGDYILPTNDEAKVTYTQDEKDEYQVFEIPYVQIHQDQAIFGTAKDAQLTNWDDRTYDITLNAWSNRVSEGTAVTKYKYVEAGTVTPSKDNVGKSYLVYTGQGSNNPVSQNPEDYQSVTVQKEEHREPTGGYQWKWHGGFGTSGNYNGAVYERKGLFDYKLVGHTSTFTPEPGVTYYGDGSFTKVELSYEQEYNTYTTYYWSDNHPDAPRMTYKKEQYTDVEGGGKVLPIENVTVTDVVEDVFTITDVGYYDGAGTWHSEKNTDVVSINGNKVTWTNQTLSGNRDNSWKRVIKVQAKETYIGGNNVPTNVEEQSGIQIGNSELFEFDPQPFVNVKVDLEVGNAENTIFLGASVPYTETEKVQMKEDAQEGVTYTWDTTSGENPGGLIPETTGEYQYHLTASYEAGSPTKDSNANSTIDGVVYVNGVQGNGYKVEETGTYTVHVIAGQLTVTKVVEDTENMDPDQTFLFHVKNETTGKTFDVVLKANESKTITGLAGGNYTVTEDESWSWRYEAQETTWESGNIISRETPDISASVTNTKDNNHWFGDYDSVTNYFENQQ